MNLWPHQQDGIEKALTYGHAGWWVPPGGGKSRMALTALQEWGPDALPCLILCPSHSAHIWESEGKKWLPGVRVRLLAGGSTKARIWDLAACRGIAVLNFEAVHALRFQLSALPWKTLIVDEGHHLATPGAKVTRSVDNFLGDIPRRIVMTAWPAYKNLDDVFTLFRLVDGGEALGRRFNDFRMEYFRMDPSGYGWSPQVGAERRIAERIGPKSTVLSESEFDRIVNLPPVQFEEIRCPLLGWQREIYKTAKAQWQIGEQEINGAGVLAQRLLQISSGVIQDEFRSGAKTQTLLRWIQENVPPDDRIVVFAWFRPEVEGIATGLREELGRAAWRIYGGVKTAEALTTWRETPGGVIVVQASMGYGWPAVEARHVVFHSRPFTASTYHQCIRRVRRPGQTRPVQVTNVIASQTTDEVFFQALQEEKSFIDFVRDLVLEKSL